MASQNTGKDVAPAQPVAPSSPKSVQQRPVLPPPPGAMQQRPMLMAQQGMPPGQAMTNIVVVPPIPGVPPGLEVLHSAEYLFIRQTVQIAEFFYNAPNKYEVMDAAGQRLFFAAETTECCTRYCCGIYAPFELDVLNFQGGVVLRMEGSPGCCECDAKVNVLHSGVSLGTVAQTFTFCSPVYYVKNAAGEIEFIIRGPGCGACCCVFQCQHSEFSIFLPDGLTQVASIHKHWGGTFTEMFTTADIFGINFPRDLSVNTKALLMGATFLIDFQYFENKGSGSGHHGQGGRAMCGGGRRMKWLSLILSIAIVIVVGYFGYKMMKEDKEKARKG